MLVKASKRTHLHVYNIVEKNIVDEQQKNFKIIKQAKLCALIYRPSDPIVMPVESGNATTAKFYH